MNIIQSCFKLMLSCSVAILISCGGGSSNDDEPLNNDPSTDPEQPPITSGNWYRPAPLVTWQWQLQGTIDTSHVVDIYDIDLFNSTAELIQQLQNSGMKVICYFSAGSYEDFREDASDFKPSELGNMLDGWPDERWLDIRSDNVRDIMKKRLDFAITQGCDGVEPDNMDGYLNNPGFDFNAQDQLAYNRFIANEAHQRNLSVGLKNDLDQILQLVEYYDFAVNEQCFEYDECNLLVPFINAGKAVLNAEYLALYRTDMTVRGNLCADALTLQVSSLILPLDLDGSFRDSCH